MAHNEEKSLMSIVVSLAVDVIENIQSSVEHSIREKTHNLVRKVLAVFLCAIGTMLALNGVAVLIDTYAGNYWVGHFTVGVVVFIAGVTFLNTNH